jgi:hypothetical protein
MAISLPSSSFLFKCSPPTTAAGIEQKQCICSPKVPFPLFYSSSAAFHFAYHHHNHHYIINIWLLAAGTSSHHHPQAVNSTLPSYQ